MDAPRIAEVHKRLFLPGGGHLVVRKDEQQKARPRIQMIPNLADLARGPHIPMGPLDGPKRLVAYCGACGETVRDLPAHVRQDDNKYVAPEARRRHEIRFMLLPDLRAARAINHG
jgi:hypothetical protein